MRAKRPHILLVQSWWEDRVLRGVGSYAREHGWVLDCSMRWTHRVMPLGTWRGDGIIAYSGIVTPRPDIDDFLRTAGVPVVETQHESRLKNTARVVIPRAPIGQLAAEHLRSLGFRNFGFVTFEENVIETQRRSGFCRQVKAAGGTFHALDFAQLPHRLDRLPKPLGLMAANDVNALAVIHACSEAGIAVPEEIAVVGVDDTEILCDLAPIPLTSVNCNYERQGWEAAAMLDGLMRGEPPPKRALNVAPLGVTVRRSTDTVAMPDRESAGFLRHLRDRFCEPLSLEQGARALGVSLRRVQVHFQRHLGRTPVQELNRLRVERAKLLLADSRQKMAAVAGDCGFSNRHHFMRAFRRGTGMTPRDFRAWICEGDQGETTMR